MTKNFKWFAAVLIFLVSFLSVLVEAFIHSDTLNDTIKIVVSITDASLVSLCGVDYLKSRLHNGCK